MASKVAESGTSMGVLCGGRAALQVPHLPLLVKCLAGIRLEAPHAVHTRIIITPQTGVVAHILKRDKRRIYLVSDLLNPPKHK